MLTNASNQIRHISACPMSHNGEVVGEQAQPCVCGIFIRRYTGGRPLLLPLADGTSCRSLGRLDIRMGFKYLMASVGAFSLRAMTWRWQAWDPGFSLATLRNCQLCVVKHSVVFLVKKNWLKLGHNSLVFEASRLFWVQLLRVRRVRILDPKGTTMTCLVSPWCSWGLRRSVSGCLVLVWASKILVVVEQKTSEFHYEFHMNFCLCSKVRERDPNPGHDAVAHEARLTVANCFDFWLRWFSTGTSQGCWKQRLLRGQRIPSALWKIWLHAVRRREGKTDAE